MTKETVRNPTTDERKDDKNKTQDREGASERDRASDPGNTLATGVETNPIEPGRTGNAHSPG